MTTLAATLDVLYALRYIIAAITAALLVAFWYERGQRNLDAILAAELAQIDADRRDEAHKANVEARWY